MNVWENAVITKKGLALQSKLTQGHTLNLTRAVVGSGWVSPDLLKSQTAVTDPFMEAEIGSASYPEQGACTVPVVLTNDKLAAGNDGNQIGVCATDPDEGEILYFIVQAGKDEDGVIRGVNIPSAEEMPGYSAEWTFKFQYGQADGVTVMVDPTGTVSRTEYVEKITVIEEKLDEKAETDLSNVPDVVFLEKAQQAGAGGTPEAPATSQDGGVTYIANVAGITELKPGITIVFTPDTTSTSKEPILDVNGLGPKVIRRRLSNNLTSLQTGYSDQWLAAGKPLDLIYDGKYWVANGQAKPAAVDLYGMVQIENGGTGADNAADARKNLGAASFTTKTLTLQENKWTVSALFDDVYCQQITDEAITALVVAGKTALDVQMDYQLKCTLADNGLKDLWIDNENGVPMAYMKSTVLPKNHSDIVLQVRIITP